MLIVFVEGVKWQKREVTPGCRGVITVPVGFLSNRRCGSGVDYRGRSDRRHSGPSNYHHQPPTNGNDFGPYNGGGGGYRGRGRPIPTRGSSRWSSANFSSERVSHSGFTRGGRYDNSNRGRNFDTRNRGPSGDDFRPKYYGNCEVRLARDVVAPAKPRGFYRGSTPSTSPFP